ncbi:plasma-membrane proton-efflux P-type ATPase [Cupriavidus pinatubonensis]|uniref:plasma-membrane proton-efflux P-type ATPase n=1 Tax=Cupriavidus pinatubonensis TaxID=248026 RepID=UPI001C72C57E|nr:plasma-membrane proton-efflux P-type ATPase [Cupriavidus pinatubonensis]QYY32761.1 plasma-membrane proton-efflux P-type ATPase [Cupriavidus pinatubonensis]
MMQQENAQQALPRAVAETLQVSGSNCETGLSRAEAQIRLKRDGPNEVPERKPHYVLRFLAKFWGLSAWMVELIALLSLVLHKTTDLVVALLLLVVNAVLSFLQEQRASAAVAALRQQLNITVRTMRDGSWKTISAKALVRGDIVRVRAGDFVPADMLLVQGNLRLDQAALTGESREVERTTGDTLYGGATVCYGEGTGIVTATGVKTYFGRTTELVASAHPKLHVEEVVSRVVRWLFLIVGTLVLVTLVVSYLNALPLLDTLPIALVLLMSAVPVALPVMFTVSMALGSMELSRQGVLITRLSGIEDAATMDVLCTDKTGTLTMNQLSLKLVQPRPGFSDDDVVRFAALASNLANADPIDLAFLRAAGTSGQEEGHKATILSFQPFSAATRRTEAIVSVDGGTLRCVKGALRTVAEAAGLSQDAIMQLEDQASIEARKGERVLAVARAFEAGPLELIGLAYLYDAPRPDSARLIAELRRLGLEVKMLTGDALPVAQAIAAALGLGTIARVPDLHSEQSMAKGGSPVQGVDGYAEVFPEDKFLVVKRLQEAGHVVGMTGDGVNDAPALRQAEVGIAVSGASDVAKGAASAVLTHEGLVDIVDMVKSGRAIYQRVLTWIINKVSRTILKAGFVVVAFLATGRFAISALGMVLLVFMTDFVKIALATDRVHPSKRPETWNIGPLVRVAIALGFLMLVESLALLAFGWHRFGLADAGGKLQTFTFQTLLFFALFSIVSVRERRAFWSSRPSRTLAIAIVADAALGLFIGIHGLAELRPLPLAISLVTFTYAGLLVLGPNDLLKTLLTRKWGSVGS